jgi:putative transposase
VRAAASLVSGMSRKYKILDQSQLYFVTFTIIYWLDVFTRQEYRDIFLDSVRYCQKNKGLEVCAYCMMSSHVHMIIGRNKEQGLDGIIRDLKKFTSTQIIEAIRHNPQESRKELFMWLFGRAGKKNSNNTNYQFWQQNNQPIMLTKESKVYEIVDYIHNNPVVAGIVRYPDEYLYSSASNYARKPECVLDVIVI